MVAGSVSGTPGIWKCTCGLGIMSRSRSIPFLGLAERAPGRRNWRATLAVYRVDPGLELRARAMGQGLRIFDSEISMFKLQTFASGIFMLFLIIIIIIIIITITSIITTT